MQELTKAERSTLAYAETCVVDASGLLVGERMNADDLNALKKFRDQGLLDFGRIPARLLGELTKPGAGLHYTHWVTFHDGAWELAHQVRRQRAQQIGPNRRKVNAELGAARGVPGTKGGDDGC